MIFGLRSPQNFNRILIKYLEKIIMNDEIFYLLNKNNGLVECIQDGLRL